MNAFGAAAQTGRAGELEKELTELFESENRGSSDCTEIPATYLKLSVTKD